MGVAAAQQDDIGQQVASEGWAHRKSYSCPFLLGGTYNLGVSPFHTCKKSKVCYSC